ncbi:MAG: InlB B-repeat-containing protein [Treponema sp.]|nr:InlB B-repeat-containing protein [Treponema sp.]
MKNIYKTFTFAALVMFFALFTACEFNKSEDSAKNVKPKTEIENPSENTKALLTINASIDTSGNMAGRKLMTDEDSVELFYKRYVKFVLKGSYEGPGPADSQFNKIKTWNNYEELINDTELELKPGEYELKLEGYYYREKDADGTSYLYIPLTSGNITVELVSNETNEISFVLLPNTWNTNGVASGNGMPFNFLISVADYSGLYTDAELNIYDYDNFIRGVEESECLISTKTGDKFNFSDKITKSSYTEYDILINSLSPGRYWIKGKLKDNAGNERVFCNEQMIIVAGNYIEKAYEVGRYKLNYVLNGGIIDNSYISGVTEEIPWGYYVSDLSVNLPIPVREGYVFKGWFMDADFTPNNSFEYKEDENGNETSVTFNKYGTLSGDKTLYAKWAEAVTVNYYVYGEEDYKEQPYSVQVLRDKTIGLNNFQLLDFDEYERDCEDFSYYHSFGGWYTDPITTSEYTGTKVTSLSSFGTDTVINLYGFVGEQFGNGTQANNYRLGQTYRAYITNISNLPDCKNLTLGDGDTLSYTTTIISNKDVTLKADLYGYGNSNSPATVNGQAGQDSITVTANTITEINWTLDVEGEKRGTELNYAPALLLYVDTDDYSDEYLTGVIINCVYSNIQKTKGTSDFVLWNKNGIKDTFSLNLKKYAFYYTENDTDEDGTNDEFIYNLPSVLCSYTTDPETHEPIYTYDYTKLITPKTSSGTDPNEDFYTNPGFAFLGWYDDPEFTTQSQNIQVSEAENGGNPLPSKTYYAKWGIYATPVPSTYPTEYENYFVAHIPYSRLVEIEENEDRFWFKKGKEYLVKISGKSESNFDYRTNSSAVNAFKIRLTSENGESDHASSYTGSVTAFYNDRLTEAPNEFRVTITEENISWTALDDLYIDIMFPTQYVRYTTGLAPEQLIPASATELILSDWEFSFEEYPVCLSKRSMLYENNGNSLLITSSNEIPYNKEAVYKVHSTNDYSKIDSTIDKDGNVYVLDFDNTGNFFIVKNGSELFSQSSLASIGVTDKISITDLYIGYEANYLYAAGDDGHGATDFVLYDLDNNSISYGKFSYRFEKDSPYYEMTDFAVLRDSGVGYTGGRIFASYVPKNLNLTELQGFDKRYIAAADFVVNDSNEISFYPYLTTEYSQKDKSGTSITVDAYSIVSYADLFGETGNSFSPDLKINDMQIVESENNNYYLYVLFSHFNFKKEKIINGEGCEDPHYYLENYGFISRINVNNTYPEMSPYPSSTGSAGLAWDTSLGYGSNTNLFGLCKNALETSNIGDYFHYKAIGVDNGTIGASFIDYLINPQKFIAIEPKKLIIADDGLFVYDDGYGNSVRNVNRIVTVDLESLSYDFDSEAKYVTTNFSNNLTSDQLSNYYGDTYLK